MMRILVILAHVLILTNTCAWAGPEMLLAIIGNSASMETFTIQGYSSRTSTGTATTGVESGVATGAGQIKVNATCTATGIAASVSLQVDGATPSGSDPTYLLCPGGTGTSSKTLTATVTAGTHTVEVSGIGNGGSWLANNFRKTTPTYDLSNFDNIQLAPWSGADWGITIGGGVAGSYAADIIGTGGDKTLTRTMTLVNGEFSLYAITEAGASTALAVTVDGVTVISSTTVSDSGYVKYTGTITNGGASKVVNIITSGTFGQHTYIDNISVPVP